MSLLADASTVDAAKALAKRTGALLATTMQSQTFLAEDDFHVGISGQFGTRTGIQLFNEADVVIGGLGGRDVVSRDREQRRQPSVSSHLAQMT